MRVIYFSIGLLTLLLAIIGVILPLLPTTPFLLVSAFCFARSSKRLHSWLINHATFGPMITNWQRNGSIPAKAKISAIIVMILMLTLGFAFGVSEKILLIQAITLTAVGAFILSRPNA